MPTISKEHINFEEAQFCREIKVDSTGVFTIALPPSVIASGLGCEVKASTKQSALNLFNEKLALYKDSKTTIRRVICYAFKDTCRIWNQDRSAITRINSGVSFSSGTTISLTLQVFDEHKTVRPNGGLSYRYKPVESTIPEGFHFVRDHVCNDTGKPYEHLLPHTPEAEAFFSRIAFSMEALILTLAEGFKTPEAVGALVSKGTLSLMG